MAGIGCALWRLDWSADADDEGAAGCFDYVVSDGLQVVDLHQAVDLNEQPLDESEVPAGDAGGRRSQRPLPAWAELLAEIHALHSIIAALPVIERAKGTNMLSHGLTAEASVRKSSPPPLLQAVCVARRARTLTSLIGQRPLKPPTHRSGRDRAVHQHHSLCRAPHHPRPGQAPRKKGTTRGEARNLQALPLNPRRHRGWG